MELKATTKLGSSVLNIRTWRQIETIISVEIMMGEMVLRHSNRMSGFVLFGTQ